MIQILQTNKEQLDDRIHATVNGKFLKKINTIKKIDRNVKTEFILFHWDMVPYKRVLRNNQKELRMLKLTIKSC